MKRVFVTEEKESEWMGTGWFCKKVLSAVVIMHHHQGFSPSGGLGFFFFLPFFLFFSFFPLAYLGRALM